tara:strand:+ start:338 stop:739 length:402 start_codon:yes stop_codon:yes gene_type:complete
MTIRIKPKAGVKYRKPKTKHPVNIYPDNKSLKKIFRGGNELEATRSLTKKAKAKLEVCNSCDAVGYKGLEMIITRQTNIITRLSKVLVEVERKFTNAEEYIASLVEHAKCREKVLTDRIKLLKVDASNVGRPN